MVAVRPQESDRFAASPPDGIRLFLVHGNDAGAVTEKARLLERIALQRGGGDTVIRFGSDELSASQGRLADEASSASLFGGEPVLSLRVLDGRHNVLGAVKPILENPPSSSWLIVEAGELPASSALRKAFEGVAAAAAIPAYHVEGADLASLVRNAASDASILVDPLAIELLVGLLGGDRLSTRSELEKLFLYVAGSGVATAADVQAVIGDCADTGADACVDAALAGDLDRVDNEFARFLVDGGSAVALCGQLLRHLVQMSAFRAEMDGGRALSSALDRARPPIFARRRAVVEAQLRLWPSETLAAARRRIYDAITATRTQPTLEAALVSAALQDIARMARRLSPRRP